MIEEVILVNEKDEPQGKMEKLQAHQKGMLHRAFSVFIFNSKGELLLQQRAAEKYHSAGLWTNTCCSHPRFGERMGQAIERRVMEEMGMTCTVQYAFKFIYFTEFQNGLKEHELDHVYVGISNDAPVINKAEVQNWKYMDLDSLTEDIGKNPKRYTEWMKICLPRLATFIKKIELVND